MAGSFNRLIRKTIKKLIPLGDIFLTPFVFLCGVFLKFIRLCGVHRLPLSKRVLMKVGVFPVREHYYEPMFNYSKLRKSLREDRQLPGIDLNIAGQLDTLRQFAYNDELLQFPLKKRDGLDYFYHNGCFESGDAEFLYSMIRLKKPRKIIEIGSGYSTLIAVDAVKKNVSENTGHSCEIISIEPFENKWLQKLPITTIRQKAEDVGRDIFSQLKKNDILFIDSSHVIRPQGDVLFEYLELLPILNPGVVVHIHDIFTPKDYPDDWLLKVCMFWNEQYLLEAFLTHNHEYEIIGALNYLYHHHREAFLQKMPVLALDTGREPSSFWMVRK